MAAVSVGVAEGAAITGGGPQQTFTASGMTDTPKGAILFLSGASVLGTAALGAILAVGITDGTTHRCSTVAHEDTGGVTNNWRRGSTFLLQILNLTTGALVSQASFVSFSAGAITIEWSTAGGLVLPTAAFRIGVALFGGTSYSAKCGHTLLRASPLNVATEVSPIGLVPENIFFLQDRSGFDNLSRAVARSVFGVGTIDYSTSPSTVEQCCYSHGENDNTATTDVWLRAMQSFSAGRIAKTTGSLGDGPGFELIGADALNGGRFVVRNRDLTGAGENCGWLAMNFGATGPLAPGVVRHDLINASAPTSIGVNSFPTAFRPQFVLALHSLVDIAAIGTTVSSSQGSSIGIGVADATTEIAVGISSRDAAFGQTRSRAHTRIVETPSDTGGIGFRGTRSGFGAASVDVNYTTVTTVAAACSLWVIGEPSVSATLPPISMGLAVIAPAARVDQFSLLAPISMGLTVLPPSASIASVAIVSAVLSPISLGLFVVPPIGPAGISVLARARGIQKLAGPVRGSLKAAGAQRGRLTGTSVPAKPVGVLKFPGVQRGRLTTGSVRAGQV